MIAFRIDIIRVEIIFGVRSLFAHNTDTFSALSHAGGNITVHDIDEQTTNGRRIANDGIDAEKASIAIDRANARRGAVVAMGARNPLDFSIITTVSCHGIIDARVVIKQIVQVGWLNQPTRLGFGIGPQASIGNTACETIVGSQDGYFSNFLDIGFSRQKVQHRRVLFFLVAKYVLSVSAVRVLFRWLPRRGSVGLVSGRLMYGSVLLWLLRMLFGGTRTLRHCRAFPADLYRSREFLKYVFFFFTADSFDIACFDFSFRLTCIFGSTKGQKSSKLLLLLLFRCVFDFD
mmetsp:Transcript_18147/g.34434  ORF Transcript_18147/g.34434 Transcript_18147/m.34434 type:complete len:289 (-) Transcript_18147:461-1327(-)